MEKITISDYNAGTYLCTTITFPYDITYLISDSKLTN